MRKTPLYDQHVALGARMVDFAGWQMPVQYGPILDEVRRVRSTGGLFDLCHMGRLELSGPDALKLADRVFTNYCAKIPVSSIRYSLACREDGFPIDDLLVYREEEGLFVVDNASNHAAVLGWLREHAAGLDVRVTDRSDELAMLALQGQNSQAVLQELVEGTDLASIGYYKFGWGTVCGMENIRISRTGYTGEDGFEIYFPQGEAPRVWDAILEAGVPHEVTAIGLGARDTLRLEAGMALYGHEIDESHHPLEAGLSFGVSFKEEKGDWIGRAALLAAKESPTRRLVGITTQGPRVPRQGLALFDGDEEVGSICSGSVSPTLDTNIGSAYVKLGHDAPGHALELDLRGKRQPCQVCELPFYSRTRK